LQVLHPDWSKVQIQVRICEFLNISRATYYRYLPEELKDEAKAEAARIGGITLRETELLSPVRAKQVTPKEETVTTPSVDETATVTTSPVDLAAQYHDERSRVKFALGKHYPEEYKYLKEICRDTKPYLRTKDEIERYFLAVSRDKTRTPFRIFVEEFYFFKPWRVSLSQLLKKGLELVIDKQGISETPETLTVDILQKYIQEKGVTHEEIADALQQELKEEWFIKEN